MCTNLISKLLIYLIKTQKSYNIAIYIQILLFFMKNQ